MDVKTAQVTIVRLVTTWLVVALVLTLVGQVFAQDSNQEGAVFIAEVNGIISPPVVTYIGRVLDEAKRKDASLVILKLDTPGGLDTSMREIIQDMLESPVPIAVYVAPDGARAASAGLFLLMAGHVAAMAPATNTGSASPVAMGGDEIDPTMAAKVTNDAAALIRSLANRYDRNATWAEQAVRESVSVTGPEALELNVIDLVARDIDHLLQQIEGRTVVTEAGEVTLSVLDAPRLEKSMNFPERFLHILLDPNLAFILLTVGSIGIIAELYNPGAMLPGTAGVISLLLAFFALGTLPTNWAGVALIVVAVILFIIELNTDTTGILATGGIIAFVLGSMILFRPFEPGSPALPDVRVNPFLIAAMTAAVAGFMLFVVSKLVRTRHAPMLTGYEHFTGQIAQVRRDLEPEGRVWFQGQSWFARSVTGQNVTAGGEVRIVGLDELTLLVEPIKTEEAETYYTDE